MNSIATLEEINIVAEDNFIMTAKMVEEILTDFNVTNENELNEKLNGNNWHWIHCIKCGRQISLLNCSFYQGNPVCKGGCCGN